MVSVRGPIELKSDRKRVCDQCGREIGAGDTFWLARVMGTPMHVCSKKCFHLRCNAIEREVESRGGVH